MNSARKRNFFPQFALVVVTFLLACETAAPTSSPSTAEPLPDEPAFSSERAWDHLTALVEHGPRVSGTEGAERARDYITSELQRMGIGIRETPEELPSGYALAESAPKPDNVVAEIPGASDDLIVLIAPYDSRQFESFDFVGANDGASGAALLLELADVLSQQPLSFTTWLLFLDAEAPRAEDAEATAQPQLFGSQVQAVRFKADGVLSRIRLLVGFNQICDVDLAITRDLGSHRLYREDFWNAAARLGYDDIFRAGQPFEIVNSSHLPFFFAGARRVVFISDSIFGGDEPPGLYANTEDDNLDHCSSRSLQVVGEVALEALRTITHRLAKIDRFSTSPLAKLENEQEEEAVPEFDEELFPGAPGVSSDPETDGGADGRHDDAPPADASAP